VFGLARGKAGEFKALLDNSLITAQYPRRTEVLGRVAESEALPSSADLNAIYETMLQEIQAQRQVATFSAPVANVNDGAEQQVTRVGPFAIFTADNANFLGYKAPTGEDTGPLLSKLPKQPGGQISAAAQDVTKTSGSDIVYAPLDPTRGELLKSFERVPDVRERISYGGTIGYIILLLLAIGGIFGLLNIIRLFLVKMAVNGQKRKAQANKSNPLGRVMMAYDSAKSKDADTVELKLDEAILKESPKFEFGLNLLKLFAGIAPLLGLLGTVTGMIKTFQAMMIYGTGDPQWLNPVNVYNGLQEFLGTGGTVLFAIMIATFAMWTFILERFAYYLFAHKPMKARLINEWNARSDKRSWKALAIRDEMVSQIKERTDTNVAIIKTLVALAPLLGLLGTVTGMIEVFDTMALSGSSNARLMAGGVFKATIPTMAGMTAALSGLYFSTVLPRWSSRETARFADDLQVV